MPSGFLLPVHTVTRLRDGATTLSTRVGGTIAISEHFGEVKEQFKRQLKLAWRQHVDTGTGAFTFMTKKYKSGNRGAHTVETYNVEPLLMQSARAGSTFVALTATHIDNLVKYLRETKTDETARTFGLRKLASLPSDACYTPGNVEIDLGSDVFRVSFSISQRSKQCAGSVSRSTLPEHITERYYLSIPTLGQIETNIMQCVPNLRPKIKIYWHSKLEHQIVMGRIQVCQMLLATRNADHMQTILASPHLLAERQGFTEVDHVTRELTRTNPQDLTFLSRALQQKNTGPASAFLRDGDPAVAKAYRFSRQPIHMLSNLEHENLTIISLLRCSSRPPKPSLTYAQLGGPLFYSQIIEWHNGKRRTVSLCEAKGDDLSRASAKAVKRNMILSVGLLIASIVCRHEKKMTFGSKKALRAEKWWQTPAQKVMRPSQTDSPTRPVFLPQNTWMCLRVDGGMKPLNNRRL